MNKVVLSIILMFSMFSVAHGENKCSKTEFGLIDKTVTFGMTFPQAKKALKRAFRKTASVKSGDGNTQLLIVSFNKPYKNLDRIVYLATANVITRVMYSYSNKFQSRFGGLFKTLKVMLEKLVSKHGKADNVDFKSEKGKVLAEWTVRNGGAVLTVLATDPDVLNMRIDCLDLEDKLRNEQAKSANFGF